MSTEVEVRRALESLNQQIRAAHFSGSDGPAEGLSE
jgi:hypothetical protein